MLLAITTCMCLRECNTYALQVTLVAASSSRLMCLVRMRALQSYQDDDDELWSDEEEGGEADFTKGKAILESALPDLGEDMEWETDSEEFE